MAARDSPADASFAALPDASEPGSLEGWGGFAAAAAAAEAAANRTGGDTAAGVLSIFGNGVLREISGSILPNGSQADDEQEAASTTPRVLPLPPPGAMVGQTLRSQSPGARLAAPSISLPPITEVRLLELADSLLVEEALVLTIIRAMGGTNTTSAQDFGFLEDGEFKELIDGLQNVSGGPASLADKVKLRKLFRACRDLTSQGSAQQLALASVPPPPPTVLAKKT
jgi:hypothetical protein